MLPQTIPAHWSDGHETKGKGFPTLPPQHEYWNNCCRSCRVTKQRKKHVQEKYCNKRPEAWNVASANLGSFKKEMTSPLYRFLEKSGWDNMQGFRNVQQSRLEAKCIRLESFLSGNKLQLTSHISVVGNSLLTFFNMVEIRDVWHVLAGCQGKTTCAYKCVKRHGCDMGRDGDDASSQAAQLCKTAWPGRASWLFGACLVGRWWFGPCRGGGKWIPGSWMCL